MRCVLRSVVVVSACFGRDALVWRVDCRPCLVEVVASLVVHGYCSRCARVRVVFLGGERDVAVAVHFVCVFARTGPCAVSALALSLSVPDRLRVFCG